MTAATTPIAFPEPPAGFVVALLDAPEDADGFHLVAFAVRGRECRVAFWGEGGATEWGEWEAIN